MNARRMVCMIGFALACAACAACSREDSVFSMSPIFKARSDASQTTVAQCIAERWKTGTRDLSRTRRDGVIRLRAETFFTGVTIGVSLRDVAGKTLVEYFERRFADPLYVGMVRGCVDPQPSDVH